MIGLRIWAALLTFSAAVWFYAAVRLVIDTSFRPDKFAMIVAFVITGSTVTKWAIEAWTQK